jgi:hypothetical protein
MRWCLHGGDGEGVGGGGEMTMVVEEVVMR